MISKNKVNILISLVIVFMIGFFLLGSYIVNDKFYSNKGNDINDNDDNNCEEELCVDVNGNNEVANIHDVFNIISVGGFFEFLLLYNGEIYFANFSDINVDWKPILSSSWEYSDNDIKITKIPGITNVSKVKTLYLNTDMQHTYFLIFENGSVRRVEGFSQNPDILMEDNQGLIDFEGKCNVNRSTYEISDILEGSWDLVETDESISMHSDIKFLLKDGTTMQCRF